MIKYFAALILFSVITPAFADEINVPCSSLAEQQKTHKFIPLTNDQWEFMRGVFLALPFTPDSLPPGDKGVVSELDDGSTVVAFIDGDQICGPLNIKDTMLQHLKEIKNKTIVHMGKGL